MEDKYITVKGIKTRYWDEGSGQHTFVLIHGVGASVDHWEKTVPVLQKYARVIAVDLVGFGATEKPEICYSHKMFQQFLYDFLKKLKINRCILVGHSMGGGIALEFAASYPETVEKLVLVSSAGFDRKIPFSYILVSVPLMGKLLLQSKSKAMMAAVMRRFAYQKAGISDNLVKHAHSHFNSPGAKGALISAFRQHVGIQGIKKSILEMVKKKTKMIDMPVMIIWGKKDKLLSPQGALNAKKLIPQAELYFIEDCGHMPQLEQPEIFNQLLRK